jgi:methyl-accepting chemotaxis protein
MQKKPTFTALFTIICVSAIVFTTLVVMSLFFINFRSISHEQIEAVSQESIGRVQENVLAMLKEHENLLKSSAVGVNALLATYNNNVPRDVMQNYLINQMKVLPDISFLYYSNNLKWDRPVSYFVLNDGWVPDDPSYDQTTRAWFVAAKGKNGGIAYSEPYIDGSKGNLTVAISTTLFDSAGRDVGVMCEEITVDTLESMLSSKGGLNKMYLLDQKGVCLVDADGGVPMEVDFFSRGGFDAFRGSILSQGDFSGGDGTHFIYSAHIPGADYYLVSTLPVEAVFAQVNRLLFMMLCVSVLTLLVSALVTFLITRKIARPLGALEQFAATLADGDFSNASPDYSMKETSRLAAGFNTINRNISSLIQTIEVKANLIKGVGSELAGRMESSTSELSGIRTAISGIKDKSVNQAASVTETNATVGQIVGNIEALNKHIEE